jgi:phosphoglycolate phosphatase
VTPHLFLDLDGTVTDSREGIVRCIAHALATLDRPGPADDALARLIGAPLARVFETLLGTTDARLVARAIGAYRERFSAVGILENRVYPEVPAALATLTRRGASLHLVTAKPAVFARRILDHFELSPYFRRVVGPELDETRCDKTSLVRRALETERLGPDDATVIGDRGDDILGARANGVRAIGVTWGYGSRDELEAAGAEHIVGSAHALLAALGALRRFI